MTPPASSAAPPARNRARGLVLTALWWAAIVVGIGLSACATPPNGAPSDAASAASAAASAAAATAAPIETAVITPPPVLDPLRPNEHVDTNDAQAQSDLWKRVRHGFAVPDLDDDLVRKSEQWYATRPDYVARMTERSSRYLYYIVDEVEKRGMPTELALLPFIESAFNPQALSIAQASGMWQFIPSTGKTYALKQNMFRDDRRDVLASTRAALDYLGRLHDMFGDWHLALAAYNWGEGNVQRAIERGQRNGQPVDYANLKMPEETRWYVRKLQAVKNIVLQPDVFALSLPPIENHPYFLSVPIERDIDVSLAAQLAGLSVDEFKNLNPQMNRPVILAAGTPQVLLPYDNANRFVRELPQHRGPFATWTAWVAPKTMHPAEAARRIGMSEEALRQVNHIPPKMLVKVGSTLLVPRAAHQVEDVSEHLAENAAMLLAPDAPALRRVAFAAGKHGTTVAAVARQYRVSAAQVARWNQVPSTAHFHAGQTIVVFVSNTKAKGRTVAGASKHKSGRGSARVAATSSSRRSAGN